MGEQRRRRILAASCAAVLGVAVVVLVGTLSLGQNTGHAVVASGTATTDPTKSVCGPWSRAGSTFSTVVQIYGGIESCFRYDGAAVGWVITTAGTAMRPGVIGIDWCTGSTPACLDGSTDHTDDLWTYYLTTTSGSVHLFAPPKSGHPLALTVGGKQLSFDPVSATFAHLAAAETPSPAGGMLVSGIVLVGGPPQPTPRPRGYSNGRVQLSRGGRVVAETELDEQPWRLPLAPGSYTVTPSGGCPAVTLQIRAGATTHTDVTCQVP